MYTSTRIMFLESLDWPYFVVYSSLTKTSYELYSGMVTADPTLASVLSTHVLEYRILGTHTYSVLMYFSGLVLVLILSLNVLRIVRTS